MKWSEGNEPEVRRGNVNNEEGVRGKIKVGCMGRRRGGDRHAVLADLIGFVCDEPLPLWFCIVLGRF